MYLYIGDYLIVGGVEAFDEMITALKENRLVLKFWKSQRITCPAR